MSMRAFPAAFLAAFLLFGAGLPAVAAESKGLRLGLRANLGIVTQDVVEDVLGSGLAGEASTGFGATLTLTHPITDQIHLGGSLGWTRHVLDVGGVDVGAANVGTFLVQAEYHFSGGAKTSPYGVFGIGVNTNNVTEKSSCACSIAADPSLAVRVGAGIDHWVSDAVAINAEFNWTLNSSEGRVDDGSGPVEGDFKGNVLTVLIGLRLE